MVNLGPVMLQLYPDLTPLLDYIVLDKGGGPHLASWSNVLPEPTTQTLQQACDAYVPTIVFAPLSPWQVRQVLNQAGMRAAVEAIVSSGSIELKDAWQFATEFQRNNDLLNQMTAGLGMTDEQVDDMFRLGATLQPQSI